MKKTLTPLMLAALIFSATGCGGDPDSESETVFAHLSDRYPSGTPADWTTYADTVAVVRVVDEERGKPSADALKMGEGNIPRTAEFAIEEVVWQRQGAPTLPKSLDYPVLGWHFTDNDLDKAQTLVTDDQPLFAEGHSYVIALRWLEERCYDGQTVPGSWVGLGAGGQLPITNGVLGVGEFGGAERDLKTALAESKALEDTSVMAQVTGDRVEDLKKLLMAAKPAKRDTGYDPLPSDC